MTHPQPRLVLDANIILRAVFGKKTCRLMERFDRKVQFLAADACVEEAHRHLEGIARAKGISADEPTAMLRQVLSMVQPISENSCAGLKLQSLSRIASQDPNDWPSIAVALLLDAPIWTEDRDFFGCGVATWTTDRVEIYLKGDSPKRPVR